MPSKDILSIREFQIADEDQLPDLYPRTYALPQFFTTNFVHDHRIVKLFTGQNALLKAFYFNYMKLALESEDSQDYIELLKEKFVGFDLIEQGQLDDRFLSDFQYRKFFKDFIEIEKERSTFDFQATARKYPIIDTILQKLFKTVVPIGLYFPENEQKGASDFQIAIQVISYLSEEFEQEFNIQIPGKCIEFVPTDMHVYFENINEIYLAYVEEYEQEEDGKIHKFQRSSKSSFVCGEGNSFTSKFNSSNEEGDKHLFRKIGLNSNCASSDPSEQTGFKKTRSSCLSSNSSNSSRRNSDEISFDEQEGQNKSKLLEINCSMIRRRTKDSTLKNTKKVSILEPISCFQYEQENMNGRDSSLVHSGMKSESKDDDKDGANTLINILDSRVTQNESALNNMHSNHLQKGQDKSSVIIKRRDRDRKPSKTMFESGSKDDIKEEDIIQPITSSKNTSSTDPARQFMNLEHQIGLPITLPEPKPRYENVRTSLPNNCSSNASCYTFKTTVGRMEEILELGEDEDSENTIQDFCQVQSPNPSMSQRTVNLSDNISHRLMIEIIESRNINMSKTSIGHSLSTPYKLEGKQSYFQDDNNSKKNSSDTSSSQQSSQDLQKSVCYRNDNIYQNNNPTLFESPKVDKKKSFDEFMRQMKQKLPLMEQPKNQLDSARNFGSVKMNNNFEPCSVKDSIINGRQTIKFNEIKLKKPEVPVKIETPAKIESLSKQSQIKESRSKIMSNQQSQIPSGTGDFTRSDILLLLDEQYRQKIRAIKDDYKSTIKCQQGSLHKENWRSEIQHQNMSLMKESRQNTQKNDSLIKNNELHCNSRISYRQRETSIYVEEM